LILLATTACPRATQRVTAEAPAAGPRTRTPTMPLTHLRVVTLGDSLAYGAGDESHEGLAGRLENELHNRGVATVNATNLGVNGAQTTDLVSRLKQQRVRDAISGADAIVLSIGANDLFRTPGAREATLRNPMAVADQILNRMESIVSTLRTLNPNARILILGGYNPVPKHPMAPLINQYLSVWDAALASRFEKDPLVSIVRMSDVVTASRLSRYDSFHPGGSAYAEAAKRIAEMLLERDAA
jgi:lysophospholipase L1-like esterase